MLAVSASRAFLLFLKHEGQLEYFFWEKIPQEVCQELFEEQLKLIDGILLSFRPHSNH